MIDFFQGAIETFLKFIAIKSYLQKKIIQIEEYLSLIDFVVILTSKIIKTTHTHSKKDILLIYRVLNQKSLTHIKDMKPSFTQIEKEGFQVIKGA